MSLPANASYHATAAAALGVSPLADAAAVRAAYLNKIRQYPPDRCPEEFERIRDAYAILSDPRRRIQDLMAGANPMAPLADLLPVHAEGERRFAGIEAWLKALRRGTLDRRGERS